MARLEEIDKRYWLMVNDNVGSIGDSDIAVSCPICNEGRSWGKKHRLHLYIKDTYDSASIKCFNCNYTGNMYSYLKEYHPSEYKLYINEKKGKTLETLKVCFNNKEDESENEEKVDITNISTGLDFSNSKEMEITTPSEEAPQEEKVDISNISSGLDFSNTKIAPRDNIIKDKIKQDGLFLVDEPKGFTKLSDEAIEYLKKRGLTPKKEWLFSPKNNKIIFNDIKINLSEFIIVPFLKGDKWYGFQALAFKEKKFFIYMVNGNSGNKVWNIFNVDRNEPVYITESIYDSMSLCKDNVIAQLGAQLSDEVLKTLKKPIFVLDNFRIDSTAYKETLKYAEKGYSVFIWPENIPETIKDFNDIKKLGASCEKINKLIDKNVYQGMKAVLKLKMFRV